MVVFYTGFTPEDLLKELLTSDSPYIQLDYEVEEILLPVSVKKEEKKESKEEKQETQEKGLVVFADMSILSAIFWILSLIFIKVGVALLKITKFVVLLFFELCGKGIKATCLKIASKL